MFRLVYISRTDRDVGADEIADILAYARERNAREGITGILLYHNQRFLQVLEGPEDKVEACFERISRDPRHMRVGVLMREQATSKFFSQWFMGHADPTAISGADPKALISREQLKARLIEVEAVDTSQGRKDVMRDLKIYLRMVSRPQAA